MQDHAQSIHQPALSLATGRLLTKGNYYNNKIRPYLLRHGRHNRRSRPPLSPIRQAGHGSEGPRRAASRGSQGFNHTTYRFYRSELVETLAGAASCSTGRACTLSSGRVGWVVRVLGASGSCSQRPWGFAAIISPLMHGCAEMRKKTNRAARPPSWSLPAKWESPSQKWAANKCPRPPPVKLSVVVSSLLSFL